MPVERGARRARVAWALRSGGVRRPAWRTRPLAHRLPPRASAAGLTIIHSIFMIAILRVVIAIASDQVHCSGGTSLQALLQVFAETERNRVASRRNVARSKDLFRLVRIRRAPDGLGWVPQTFQMSFRCVWSGIRVPLLTRSSERDRVRVHPPVVGGRPARPYAHRVASVRWTICSAREMFDVVEMMRIV